jgi:hypothetical protein
LIICIYEIDQKEKYAMAVFGVEQWSMIQDICELTSQSTEEVVRSLGLEGPNIMVFDPRDF